MIGADLLSTFFFSGDRAAFAWKTETLFTRSSLAAGNSDTPWNCIFIKNLGSQRELLQVISDLLDSSPVFKDVDVSQHVDDERPCETEAVILNHLRPNAQWQNLQFPKWPPEARSKSESISRNSHVEVYICLQPSRQLYWDQCCNASFI